MCPHRGSVPTTTELGAHGERIGAARLNDAGIPNDGPQKATTARIPALTDPDGNRLVFTGSLD